jgi:hypothetical protein
MNEMNTRFTCVLALGIFGLAACVTPRTPDNPALAGWAGMYGYQPYSLSGKKVYCHSGVGAGAICVPADEMALLRAKNEKPDFALHAVPVPGSI